MAEPTEADRERAVSLLPDHQTWCQVVGDGDCCARDPWDCDCGTEEFRDAVAHALADERERALNDCATWLETLASPTLTNDPFIRAADWAAGLIRRAAEETGQ